MAVVKRIGPAISPAFVDRPDDMAPSGAPSEANGGMINEHAAVPPHAE